MIKNGRQPDALLGWMGSLSDPTRLRLLRLLERQELGVAELCDVLQLPQSTVSRHLKVLGDQRWVRSSRSGTTHLYRMGLDEMDPAGRRLWLLAREQMEDWATARQDELRLARRLRQRESASQAFFAGAAGQWDRLRIEMYGQSFASAALLSLLPREWVVADLGCGTGQVTADLAPHVRRVIGVDSSAAMLKAAQKRIAGAGNVQLLRGDLDAIPIADRTCDAALLLLVLSYVAEPGTVLREAGRILRPGGRLVVVDLLPHDREDFRRQMGQTSMGFELDEFPATLERAGLKPATVRALPPEPQAKGPALFLALADAGQGSGTRDQEPGRAG